MRRRWPPANAAASPRRNQPPTPGQRCDRRLRAGPARLVEPARGRRRQAARPGHHAGTTLLSLAASERGARGFPSE